MDVLNIFGRGWLNLCNVWSVLIGCVDVLVGDKLIDKLFIVF